MHPHPTVDLDGHTFLEPGPSVRGVYPLSVDVEKLDTDDRLHFVMKHVIGSNYFYEAEVKHALAAEGSRHKRVADLGCGTGIWLREVAAEFPHAFFTGVDIVDCWDRLEDEPDNIEFVIDDIKGRTRFADNTFDIVHMRQVVDFSALLDEVARILRPGGLVLSGEWSRNSVVDGMQRDISNYAPAVAQFIGLLDEVFNRNGPHAVAEDVIPLIRASGHFVDDRYVLFPFLYGQRQLREDDAAVGSVMGKQLMAHFEVLRPLFKESRSEEELDVLKAGLLHELRTKPGIMCFFYMAIARKARQ